MWTLSWRNRNQHLLTHIGHPSQKQRNDSISEFAGVTLRTVNNLWVVTLLGKNCLSQQLLIVKLSWGAGALCIPPLHCDGELMSLVLDKSPSSNYSCILLNWTMATSCPEDSVPQLSLSWHILSDTTMWLWSVCPWWPGMLNTFSDMYYQWHYSSEDKYNQLFFLSFLNWVWSSLFFKLYFSTYLFIV